MKSVRQYKAGTADVLILEDVEIPAIQQGEVLIQGLYTSVNYADIKTRMGSKGQSTFPITLGLDIVGQVIESKSSVFQKGDYVFAFPNGGSYQQVVAAKESLTFKIPETIDPLQAAALPTVTILSEILLKQIGDVQKEDTIVVHSAAGGVGTMLVKLAKHYGVSKIIGTVGDLSKKDYVLSIGADDVFTYDSFVDGVKQHTNGKGAQVIFDSVAGDVTKASLECLANFGTLVQFGNSSGKAGVISTSDVHNSCRNIKGFSLGTTRKEAPARLAPVVERIIPLFEGGQLSVPIARVYDLEEVQEAHRLIESRKHQGKILIRLIKDEN